MGSFIKQIVCLNFQYKPLEKYRYGVLAFSYATLTYKIRQSENCFKLHPSEGPLQTNGTMLLLNHSKLPSFVNKQFISEDVKNVSKRFQRRKKVNDEGTIDLKTSGMCQVSAFATAEEYNLERLKEGLIKQDLYTPVDSLNDQLSKGGADVIYAIANGQVSSELRQVYFFREGSVVFWNIPELECVSILDFLKHYQLGSYNRNLILKEKEMLSYSYSTTNKKSNLEGSNFYISIVPGRSELEIHLDKFTLSNAMSLSVKLAIWEACLSEYIDSIEYVVEDLKNGKALRISRKEVTCKTGELFALRHSINLSSDLLDVPDFYWENDDLETLYLQLCSYFSISRRTRVMNEKLNHCMELVELLTSHLSDRHHVRLEWMIIVLIMIEVVIEIIHTQG